MKRLFYPHVSDFYIRDVRVIQHDVLCDQPSLKSMVDEWVVRAAETLEGAPLKAIESTTIELFSKDFMIENVSMAHQASIIGPSRRRCSIKISVDDHLESRIEACFSALISHFQVEQKALTQG